MVTNPNLYQINVVHLSWADVIWSHLSGQCFQVVTISDRQLATWQNQYHGRYTQGKKQEKSAGSAKNSACFICMTMKFDIQASLKNKKKNPVFQDEAMDFLGNFVCFINIGTL